MYQKTKKITTALAVLAVVTAISLVTASSSGSIVTPVFAKSKSSTGKSSTGNPTTSKKSTSSTGGSTTTSRTSLEKTFFKCVTAIPGGTPSKAEVDKCWSQAFGSGGTTLAGTTLGSSTTGKRSSASLSPGGVS